MPNERLLKRDINRLRCQIEEIESSIYRPKGDLYNQRFLLQLKLKHAIRGVVLELHLAIEELLNHLLMSHFVGISGEDLHKSRKRWSRDFRTLEDLFAGAGSIGFEKKIVLLRGLG